MKVKKIIGTIVVILLIAVLALVLAVNIFGNRALKMAVETGASKALGVGVRVQDITLAVFAGKLNINGLEIDNPKDYAHPQMLTLGNAFVAVNVKSLLSDTVEIERIQLDNIALTIEQKGLTNNLQEILNNLPKSSPSQPAPEKQTAGKNLKIKQLQINGAQVSVKLLPIPGKADTVTLKLAPITLENLGTDEPMDMAMLTGIVLKSIAGGIAQQGKELLPMDMVSGLGQGALQAGQQALQAGQQAVETAVETGKKAVESVGEVGKQAGEALKGLFQKKE